MGQPKQNPVIEGLLAEKQKTFERQLKAIKETLGQVNELRTTLGLPALETQIRD